MLDHDPVFAEYHRAEDRHVLLKLVLWALAIAVTITGLAAWGVGAGNTASASTTSVLPGDRAGTNVSAASVTAPTPDAIPSAAPANPTPPPETMPATRVSDFSISITATGYQAELDACQWVRMDLGGSAPIVGAHTSCGGAIDLQMQPGDTVRLSGQGLDGSYRVLDSRDAHAGDLASTATAGMNAAVILQTCYPGTGGQERLVGLVPA